MGEAIFVDKSTFDFLFFSYFLKQSFLFFLFSQSWVSYFPVFLSNHAAGHPDESLQTHCWTYLVSLRALQCSFSFWLLDWFPLHASIMVLPKGNYFMSFALSWESCMYPSGSPCPDEEWSLYVFSIFLVSLLLLSL